MSSSNLVRWSGLTSVVGSVPIMASNFLDLSPPSYDLGAPSPRAPYLLVRMLVLLATLLVVGLVELRPAR